MVSPVHPENLERLEKQGHLVSQEFQDPRETRVLLDLREALDFKGLEVRLARLAKLEFLAKLDPLVKMGLMEKREALVLQVLLDPLVSLDPEVNLV